MIIDIEAQNVGYNIGVEICDKLQMVANNGQYRFYKVNLPEGENETFGEGCWVVIDSETYNNLKDNITDSIYKGVLMNDSVYYSRLKYGTIVPITSQGTKRPVVNYNWLQQFK